MSTEWQRPNLTSLSQSSDILSIQFEAGNPSFEVFKIHKTAWELCKGYYNAVFFPFQSFLNCDGLIHGEDLRVNSCLHTSHTRKSAVELRETPAMSL